MFNSFAPTYFGSDIGYKLYLWDDTTWAFEADILPTLTAYVFDDPGVDKFQLRVYDFDDDAFVKAPTAFILGVTFASPGRFTGSIALLNSDGSPVHVSEPGSLWLLGLGVVWLVYRGRRQR